MVKLRLLFNCNTLSEDHNFFIICLSYLINSIFFIYIRPFQRYIEIDGNTIVTHQYMDIFHNKWVFYM